MTHRSETGVLTKSGGFIRECNVNASKGEAIGLGTVARRDNSFDDAAADDVTNSSPVYWVPRD